MNLDFLHNKKVVLLFTPGLDSYLSKWYLEKHEKIENLNYVYFHINSRYSYLERQLLEAFYGFDKINIHRDIIDLSSVEKEDAYIPNRNALLITLAQSLYDPDVILINGFKDDRISDNNTNFYEKMTDMLSVSADKLVIVTSIFRNYEKSEIVKKYYHEMGSLSEIITNTFSCYNGKKRSYMCELYMKADENYVSRKEKHRIFGCMRCKACFRKLCALTAANIYIDGNFNEDMFNSFDDEMRILYPNRFRTINEYYNFRHYMKNKNLPKHW